MTDDCFSDLLCCEDSCTVFSDATSNMPELSSDVESLPPEIDGSIAGLIEDERNYVPGVDYVDRFQSHSLDASARQDSVAWILKVQRFYGFQPLTAYLSVNYFDRFLSSRCLPQKNGWPLQLLSVACLSLAAKMEEPLVPSLLDIQVEGAKFIFEPRTILRMELLVLSVLDWKLRSITPFDFIDFFAYKIDSTGTYTGFLISRATQIILSNIKEASFLEYRPSCIAAASILCAANDLPIFSLVNAEHAEKWCHGLHKEKIISCYRLIQRILINNKVGKASKVLPQLRITTWMSSTYSDTSSLSSSSSSSSLFSSSKKRKLNNNVWTDDDKESSD